MSARREQRNAQAAAFKANLAADVAATRKAAAFIELDLAQADA